MGKEEHNIKLESKFQSELIKELKERIPGCIVLKNDPNYIQGIPDLIVLFGQRWGALEVKRRINSTKQPNQDYYIGLMNSHSYAAIIYPNNKEDVIFELQLALGFSR